MTVVTLSGCQTVYQVPCIVYLETKVTGMSISQVADEALYTGLIEMQELEEPDD